MGTPTSRQLCDWVPRCLAQLPRTAVPTRFLDPASAGNNAEGPRIRSRLCLNNVTAEDADWLRGE
eukprot:1901584-Pyramimonas_sp.AAC.1